MFVNLSVIFCIALFAPLYIYKSAKIAKMHTNKYYGFVSSKKKGLLCLECYNIINNYFFAPKGLISGARLNIIIIEGKKTGDAKEKMKNNYPKVLTSGTKGVII